MRKNEVFKSPSISMPEEESENTSICTHSSKSSSHRPELFSHPSFEAKNSAVADILKSCLHKIKS
jgi:hypothetical protein